MGEDLLPAEFWKKAGPAGVQHLAALNFRSFGTARVAAEWRGGTFGVVPRKPKLPLSRTNARGILLAAHSAKVYQRIIRTLALPFYLAAALPSQLGGAPGKSCEYVSHTARLFLQRAARRGLSAAAAFLDMQSAFYRAVVELSLIHI